MVSLFSSKKTSQNINWWYICKKWLFMRQVDFEAKRSFVPAAMQS